MRNLLRKGTTFAMVAVVDPLDAPNPSSPLTSSRLDGSSAELARIALVRGEPVLTRNVRPFSRAPGLRLETC